MSSAARSAVITGVLAAPLIVAAAPISYADPGGHGSAYGLTADGLVNLPATPSVSSSGNGPTRQSVTRLPDNPLVDASALETSARGRHGHARVSDLEVAKALLRAETVSARCHAGKGSSYLGNARIAGRPLAVSPPPNSTLRVPIKGVGDASLILNRQERTANGGVTVTAMQLNLPGVHGKGQQLNVASVTCEPKPAKPQPKPTKPEAPKPTPVPRDLPVTG